MVAIWRNEWLPRSETFIRDQVGALRSWDCRKIGMARTANPLLEPDHVMLRDSLVADSGAPLQPKLAAAYRRTFGTLLAARYARTVGAGLVHAHFGPDGVFASGIAARSRLPLVVTFHGYDATLRDQASDGSKRSVFNAGYQELFRRASVLIAVSEFIAGRLVDIGAPPTIIRRCYIGIPVPPLIDEVRRRDGVCFVGRLVGKKGVSDLLQAVSMMPEPYRTVPVRIIGDGPLRPELENEADRLGVRADFLGFQSSTAVSHLLAKSKIFCGPSKTSASGDSEGFGLVFLEAAAQGLPVVAYRHGGVPEAVADGLTGTLVAEGDVGALSRALASILADPARAEAYGRAGRARVERDFDIRDRTAELEDIYSQVAAKTAYSL